MKSLILFVFINCSFYASAQAPQPAQQGSNSLTDQVTTELNRLKLDLAQQKLEFHLWKIAALELKLQKLEKDESDLASQENRLKQGIFELESGGFNAGGEHSPELLAIAANDAREELEELRRKHLKMTEDETRLADQLRREQTCVQEDQKKARKLREQLEKSGISDLP